MGGFGSELVDLSESPGLEGFQAAEPVLQADDQLGGVSGLDLGRAQTDLGAGGAIEGQDHVHRAQDTFDGDGDGEAA